MDANKYFKGKMKNESDFEKLKLYSSVQELFFNSVNLFSNEIALMYLNHKITYEDIKNDVLLLMNKIKEYHLKKGDNVSLIFKNEYDFVVSFFAVTCFGLVATIFPNNLDDKKYQTLFSFMEIKLILTNNEFLNNHAKMKNNISLFNLSNLKEIKTPLEEKEISKIIIKKEDPAVIMFTGGTTGLPKGAILSHRNLCRGAYNGALVEGKVFFLKYLSLIPFTHIFGLVKNLLTSFITGSTLYLLTNPINLVKEAKTFSPEVMVLTPGLANMVLTIIKKYSPSIFGDRFSQIICGGANVPPRLIHEFRKYHISLYPGYGLTEAANLVSGNANLLDKDNSVGVLYDGQEAKIKDGELYLKGDNVFLGYYKNEKATKEIFEDGYLMTGDLAHFDDDGFLYIDGRKNNLIILPSGIKISPESLEGVINTHPLIKDSLVYLNKKTSLLEVEIFLYENNEVNQEIVKHYINEQINQKMHESYGINKVVFLTQDFLRTPAMKIIRDKHD